MNLPTFGQLLSEYMRRSGISDSELARNIGVRRQTIFRWKEGLVERPRSREDVLQCAKKLRLTDDECDRLLLAAGFAPEQLASGLVRELSDAASVQEPVPLPVADTAPATDYSLVDDATTQAEDTAVPVTTPPEPFLALPDRTLDESPALAVPISPVPVANGQTFSFAETVSAQDASSAIVTPRLPMSAPFLPSFTASILRLLARRYLRWWLVGGAVLVVALLGLIWARSSLGRITPTPAPPATVVLHPPPQTTPTAQPIRAHDGETLLLIAPFKGYIPDEPYNVAGRIHEELEQQITTAGLISTTVASWPEEITTMVQARLLLSTTKAILVIWGEYDSGRVRGNLTARDPAASKPLDFNLTANEELKTTINEIVPKEIRDTALLALGMLARDQSKYSMSVARRLRDLGNDEAAAAVFQHALDLKPSDPTLEAQLNFYLGYLTAKGAQLDDYERAIAYYSRAFALDDQLYTALYNRGTVQIDRVRLLPANETLILAGLNAALVDLTAVIDARANEVDAYLNRAIAYYERDAPEDMTAALADLDHVIAGKADSAQAYYIRGLVQIRMGQGLQWVDDFQQALALKPDYYEAVSGLCWGYALAQQAEKALTYCEQAVKYDKKTAASRDSRAIVYAQLGRYADAVTDFRAYLEWLDSQSSMILYERSRGRLVEQWITELEAGKNPFDRALLEKLRHRDHD